MLCASWWHRAHRGPLLSRHLIASPRIGRSSRGLIALMSACVAIVACTSDSQNAVSTQVADTSVPNPVDGGAGVTSTVVPTTAAPTATSSAITSVSGAPLSSITVAIPAPIGYVFPIASGVRASYAHEHHDYPASDIIAACDSQVVSPVDGIVLEVRRVDAWNAATDNPAARGGRSVTILGDDGVRYYEAHFARITDGLEPAQRVAAGQEIGLVGRSGKSGACHLHFAISPPCPGKEWKVRRGVIWPWPYLDAWRAGTTSSPVDEAAKWATANPGACADAIGEPTAADA